MSVCSTLAMSTDVMQVTCFITAYTKHNGNKLDGLLANFGATAIKCVRRFRFYGLIDRSK